MKVNLQVWRSFSLFYVALPVVLLTLNPFDFQAFVASEFWVWRFSVEDFSRNVLLLIPFGLMLRYSYQCPHRFSLLAGLLLSGLVEAGQLFVVERTSNVVDLISNSSGALLGSLIYQGVFHSAFKGAVQGSLATLTLPLAFMLMPLCWIIAIVSSFRPGFAWAIAPCMMAGLALFRFTPLHALQKQIAHCVWISIAILPLLNARLAVGIFFLASVPIILYGIAKATRSQLHIAIPTLLFMSLGIVLQQTYAWYSSIEDWVWISSRHLSWMTVLLSVMIAGSSLVWYYYAEQLPVSGASR